MPISWTTFGPLTTSPMADLDQMFSQVAAQSYVPCIVAGTNTLTLTGTVTNFPLAAYGNYMMFCGPASAGNTGAVTAAYGALASLPVYKDGPNGPVPLQGGEFNTGDMVYLTYDSALNSGNGGFHIAISGSARRLSTSASVAFSITLGGGVNNQFVSLSGVSIGDVVMPGIFTPASVGIAFQAFCQVNNTITMQAMNYTGASILPPAGLYRFLVERSRP
jgi:hypothetical protein